MIKRIRSGRWWSRGQSAVVVIIALPVLVGGLALVFDVGDLYIARVRIQTATDAAVLAGGNYLPSYPDSARETARDYANTNGIANEEIVSIEISDDNRAVMMTVRRHVPCAFCAVLGATDAHAAEESSTSPSSGSSVTARATAVIVPVRSARGVVPIGVDYRTPRNFGQMVRLKQGQVGPGNWAPLALGGPGADTYRDNIKYGHKELLTVDDWLTTQTGNVVGPTGQGTQYRLDQGQALFPSGTFADHALNDPRVVVVPMVDFDGINGNSQVPLKGFAVLWLVGLSDNNNTIDCYFIQQSVPDAVPDPNSDDYGASSPVLIR
jgi:Flp pilus assembly protein TadG